MEIKKTMSANNSHPGENLKNPLVSNNEDHNHISVFICKKVEKLSSAVYMITNFIPNDDPLRTRLRDITLRLLSEIMSLKTKGPAEVKKTKYKTSQTNYKGHIFIQEALTMTDEINALLEIGYFSGHISKMNFSIIKQEYALLSNFLNDNADTISSFDNIMIPVDFFDARESNALSEDKSEDNILKSSEDNSAQVGEPSSKGQAKGHREVSFRKNTAKINTTTMHKRHTNINTHTNTNKSGYDKREGIIRKLLEKKPFVTVKDVTKVINDCSEKTLQRALISLVKRGVLKKDGERRWSTYKLV